MATRENSHFRWPFLVQNLVEAHIQTFLIRVIDKRVVDFERLNDQANYVQEAKADIEAIIGEQSDVHGIFMVTFTLSLGWHKARAALT